MLSNWSLSNWRCITVSQTENPTPCFVARPSGPPRAGIVVMMEGNGMGWQLLRVCERLASEGYVARYMIHRSS